MSCQVRLAASLVIRSNIAPASLKGGVVSIDVRAAEASSGATLLRPH